MRVQTNETDPTLTHRKNYRQDHAWPREREANELRCAHVQQTKISINVLT